MAQWLEAERFADGLVKFACEQVEHPARIVLTLAADSEQDLIPELSCEGTAPDIKLAVVPADSAGQFAVAVTVPPADNLDLEDEVQITIRGEATAGIPECRILLRRSTCRISTALVERYAGDAPLRWQCRASLLWYAWKRYAELVGLRRFTSGKSGSDVLVFRPRLREPDGPVLEGSLLPEVVSRAWGSCLLVKTGKDRKVREEWDAFRVFLTDRLHPFMSKCEEFLTVHPAEICKEDRADSRSKQRGTRPAALPVEQRGAGASDQATLIGSFLGGDLIRAEAFEQFFQGGNDASQCIRVLDKLFAITGIWYEAGTEGTLGQWPKIFRQNPDGRLHLFGKFDLTDKAERQRYAGSLAWDIDWLRHEHLREHLLGRGQNCDGLLYRLRDWPARYSLIHGDLHSRNVLCDDDNVWLLDFGEVGVAPTLFDFAKLEIYVRLWCLRLSPSGRHFDEAAHCFESLLLDHVTGSESSLEPVRRLADDLGIAADDLLKAAHVICAIRRCSLRYGLNSSDRRDYLAVLYLALLDCLRFAGRSPELTWNYRLLLAFAWTVEDILSRLAGMEPFRRNRVAMDPRRLVTKDWLAASGASGRVLYVMNSADGEQAIAPLAATRGILQNDNHHLDVFDHTLLVLAYVEQLVDDPVARFLDPQALDIAVREDLQRQGILQPDSAAVSPSSRFADIAAVEPMLNDLRQLFSQILDPETKLALKWCALLHDVGKPATRTLTVSKKGEAKIQFLGHERYGLELVRRHMSVWFSPPCPQGDGQMVADESDWVCSQCRQVVPRSEMDFGARVERLIRYHHVHHQLVNHYVADPSELPDDPPRHSESMAILTRALTADYLTNADYKDLSKIFDPEVSESAADFPLLILHGFADLLACRGPATNLSLRQVAEIDLHLLAAYLRYPRLKERYLERQEDDRKLQELTRGFDAELGIQGRDLGKIIKHTQAWCQEDLQRRRAADLPGPDREEALAEARSYASQEGIAVQETDDPGNP